MRYQRNIYIFAHKVFRRSVLKNRPFEGECCKMNHRFPLILITTIIITSFLSCIGTAPTKEVQLIDSLNQHAYNYRYKSLDISFQAAKQAYDNASMHKVGKAEACNNLGFCAFMQMDFDAAEKRFKEVYDLTQNELELLIADIGLMKIYQRTAMNKEFYDSRNSAIRRIKRIDEDRSLFIESNERTRLNFAYTEFSIVTAIYYYYLQQVPEAISSINEIKPELELANDTSQLLYYHYIKGSAALTAENTPDRRRLAEFDELYFTWLTAAQGGYRYFEGNGLQGLANLMVSPDNYNFYLNRRSHALSQFGFPVDTLLPLQLARQALSKFKEYNDIYQIAGAYVSIGRYLNEHGSYQEALDTLTKALNCVNLHHKLYYTDKSNDIDILQPYVRNDTIYTEISWIMGVNENSPTTPNIQPVKTVPEWISRIREQLSVSYAGLGMKVQSDYNRNIYIDILRFTRQNKELESRYDMLQQESKQLNILLGFLVLGVIILFLMFWLFNNHSKKRNEYHINRLKLTLDICQKIISAIPTDIVEEEDMLQSICQSIQPDMKRLVDADDLALFLTGNEEDNLIGACKYRYAKTDAGIWSEFALNVPDKEQSIGVLKLLTGRILHRDEQTLVQVITPYIAWALDNGMTLISLGNEREKLENERYIYEQHIARNKRENIVKKACMSIINGIVPYIDRIINEIYKLKEKGFIHNPSIKKIKYDYINELVTTINEYNDILALWIKMKQGSLNLNIENFALDELFTLVEKGRKTFEMRNQVLEVVHTDAIIKADKALTLFMINTLAENARKYTPEGGKIKVSAQTTDHYVEIAVEDNGRGLSPEDVSMIKDEKVYDSRMIGMKDQNGVDELMKMKGSGFGLMNCRGIIEKYRKTNKIFSVCTFSVDSTLRKGSRFYFRLPLGIRKNLGVCLLAILPFALGSCQRERQPNVQPVQQSDSLASIEKTEYDRLLTNASLFADTAYYCNIIEEYTLAIQYVDSAIYNLNQYYRLRSSNQLALMSLTGDDIPGELVWWNQPFETDYHVVLDIRNEAAVALLALKRWDAYTYNNKAYTSLFKIYHEDQSLEAFCMELERSTTNKMVGIALCILLLAAYFTGYYVFYIRKRLINRWNLEHVLDINQQIFSSSVVRTEESLEMLQLEENALKLIPGNIVNQAFGPINELIEVDTLGLAVYNQSTNQLEFSSQPAIKNIPEIVRNSYQTQERLTEGRQHTFPLIVETGEKQECVGVFYIEKPESSTQETDNLFLELITRYVSIVVFNAIVKLALRYRDIESAYEDTHRASWEDSMLHVQNMVLDNCLSTIKHETIYYPNKIKQIINKLSDSNLGLKEEKESIDTIDELIEYYKGIFSILSSCASRQLEEVTFRRTNIPVSELLLYADKYFRKILKGKGNEITLKIDNLAEGNCVIGDLNQLQFLFESLISEALTHPEKGIITLQAVTDNGFIRFNFTDKRREKSVLELNQLFYPDLSRMTAGEKGVLKETEYLICKQIIRDHDEYASRRGCRINAEPAEGGGFTVYFTIPKR